MNCSDRRQQPDFTQNEVRLAKGHAQGQPRLLRAKLEPATVDYFKTHKAQFFNCRNLALDTTKQWNPLARS